MPLDEHENLQLIRCYAKIMELLRKHAEPSKQFDFHGCLSVIEKINKPLPELGHATIRFAVERIDQITPAMLAKDGIHWRNTQQIKEQFITQQLPLIRPANQPRPPVDPAVIKAHLQRIRQAIHQTH